MVLVIVTQEQIVKMENGAPGKDGLNAPKVAKEGSDGQLGGLLKKQMRVGSQQLVLQRSRKVAMTASLVLAQSTVSSQIGLSGPLVNTHVRVFENVVARSRSMLQMEAKRAVHQQREPVS